MQNNHIANSAVSAGSGCLQDNSPCIEELQHAIVDLLLRNETLRFELFSMREKLTHARRTVFGVGRNEPRNELSPHLLDALRDLCLSETFRGEDSTPADA